MKRTKSTSRFRPWGWIFLATVLVVGVTLILFSIGLTDTSFQVCYLKSEFRNEVPDEVHGLRFSLGSMMNLWDSSDFTRHGLCSVTVANVATSSVAGTYTVLYPLLLNGNEPQSDAGTYIVGVVSAHRLVFKFNGADSDKVTPVAECPSSTSGGPSIYLFEVYEDELDRLLNPTEEQKPANPISSVM